MKKAEFMYLFLVIIAAEFIFIFPALFPRNQDQTKAMASSSSETAPAHDLDAPPSVQALAQAPKPAASLAVARPIGRTQPAARPEASAERAPNSAVLASQFRTLAVTAATPQPRATPAPNPREVKVPATPRRVSRIAVAPRETQPPAASPTSQGSRPPTTAQPVLAVAAAPIEKPPTPRQDSKPPASRQPSKPTATARPALTVATAPNEKPQPKPAPKPEDSKPLSPQDSKPPASPQPALKIAAAPIGNRVTMPLAHTASADIFEFDATATQLFRGQKTFLCVGVASGVKASITGVGRVAAGLSSCHRIAPQRTTTYVLHVAAAGASAERSITVDVHPPSWRPQKSGLPGRHRFDVPPGYIITLP